MCYNISIIMPYLLSSIESNIVRCSEDNWKGSVLHMTKLTALKQLVAQQNEKILQLNELNNEIHNIGSSILEEAERIDKDELQSTFTSMLDSQTKYQVFIMLKS